MAVTVVKTSYHNLEPKIINHRKDKDFSKDRFREVLTPGLLKITIDKKYEEFNTSFEIFRQFHSEKAKMNETSSK